METLLWDRDEVLFQIRRRYQQNLDLSYSVVLEDFPKLLFAAASRDSLPGAGRR